MTVAEHDRVVSIGPKQWRRRFRSWRRWLIAAVALGVVVAMVWVVFFSTVLGVRTVDVQGAHDVPSAQVVAAAHVAPGTPLARADLGAIQARVEAIPAIASASVSRSWPHTIVVHVTERQPIAVVHQDGAWWVMDKDAVLFAKVATRSPDQPIVEINGTPAPGTLRAVASVLGTLSHDLLATTRRVTASSMDSITLVLKNGAEVRWGNAGDSAQKAQVLAALLHQKARMYDVSIPSQPAIRR